MRAADPKVSLGRAARALPSPLPPGLPRKETGRSHLALREGYNSSGNYNENGKTGQSERESGRGGFLADGFGLLDSGVQVVMK